MWFKAGLVNRRGEKPSDFDKKYQAFLRKQAKNSLDQASKKAQSLRSM